MFGSATHRCMLDSRSLDFAKQTALIISNEEMNYIMKIVKEQSGSES